MYKKESSIDILTQYTIFLNTSCFFFWLRGFLNFTVKTTSSYHSFVFWNRYPFSLPVGFQLWNLTAFCWFLSFCSDSAAIQTNRCLFVFLPKISPLQPRNHAVKSLVPGPSGNTNIVGALWELGYAIGAPRSQCVVCFDTYLYIGVTKFLWFLYTDDLLDKFGETTVGSRLQ